MNTHFENKLEQLINDNLNRVFPAISLTVIHHDEIVINRAWGWIDPDTQLYPVTLDSRFDLASVTKLFTATAFLSLVSEGKVALDTPLVSIVPEFGAINPRGVDGGQDPHSKVHLPISDDLLDVSIDPTQITFYQLLTHTAGLPAWRDVFNAVGQVPAPPEQFDTLTQPERWAKGLKAICEYKFIDLPNKHIHYSDIGLLLLGEAVSRLHTGKSGQLDQVIRKRVTEPLGLTSMMYNPLQHGIKREMIVPTEDDPTWRGRRCWGEVHDENACGVGGIAGHAGLFATSSDIALFGQAWLRNDQRLNIHTDLMTEAKQQHIHEGVVRRGLGFLLKSTEDTWSGDLVSDRCYGHTGFTGTSLCIDPEKDFVIATLTNRVYPGRHVEGIHAFRRALHDLIVTAQLENAL